MRIISQDGNIDINYDDFTIEMIKCTNGFEVLASSVFCADNEVCYSLGTFTDEKEARIAFRGIHNSYMNNHMVYTIQKT